jgi:hypothetical protein
MHPQIMDMLEAGEHAVQQGRAEGGVAYALQVLGCNRRGTLGTVARLMETVSVWCILAKHCVLRV